MRRDNFGWLDVPAEEAAQRLPGCELVRGLDGREIRVRIVASLLQCGMWARWIWLGCVDPCG